MVDYATNPYPTEHTGPQFNRLRTIIKAHNIQDVYIFTDGGMEEKIVGAALLFWKIAEYKGSKI